MARLPDSSSLRRRLPQNQSTVVPASGIAAHAGRGLETLGNAVGELADVAHRMHENERLRIGNAFAARQVASAREGWTVQFRERVQDADRAPAGFAQKFDSHLKSLMSAEVAKAPTAMRDDVRLRLDSIRSDLLLQADRFERTQLHAAATEDLETAFSASENAIRLQPHTYNDALDASARAIADDPYLLNAERQSLSVDVRERYVKAMMLGEIDQGRAADIVNEIESGAYGEKISPEVQASVLREANRKLKAEQELDALDLSTSNPGAFLARLDEGAFDRLTPKQMRVYGNLARRGLGEQAYEAHLSAIHGEAPDAASDTPSTPTRAAPPAVQEPIDLAAAAVGVDADMLTTIAWLESRFDVGAKNPKSTAAGLFQFIDGTAEAYSVEDRFDPQQSATGAAKLAKANNAMLAEALGSDPEPWQTYLAHQQGAAGAEALLTAEPNALAIDVLAPFYKSRAAAEAAVTNNGGHAAIGASAFADLWRDRYAAAEKTLGADAGATHPGDRYMTAGQVSRLRSAKEAALEAASERQRLELAINGGVPFDDETKQDRDIRDRFWADTAAALGLDQTTDSGTLASAAVQFTRTVGSAPKPVVDRLRAGLMAKDPETVVEAAEGAYALAEADRMLWDRIGGKHEDFAGLATTLLQNGYSAKDAVSNARAAVFPDDPRTADERRKRLTAGGEKSLLNVARADVLDELDLQADAPTADVVLGAFSAAYEAAFIKTGDDEASKALALNRIQRVWSETNVGAGGVVQYRPEDWFGAGDDPDANAGWMNKQLAEDVADFLGYQLGGGRSGISLPVGSVRDFFDAPEAADAIDPDDLLDRIELQPYIPLGARRPVGYLIIIDGEPLLDFSGNAEAGLLEPTISGEPVVWTPEFHRTAEAAEARKAQADSVERARDQVAERKRRQRSRDYLMGHPVEGQPDVYDDARARPATDQQQDRAKEILEDLR